MLKKFNEYFVQAQFEPIKSFRLKDEMNPDIWTDYKINDEVREELIQIAQDYFESLDLGDVELSDKNEQRIKSNVSSTTHII